MPPLGLWDATAYSSCRQWRSQDLEVEQFTVFCSLVLFSRFYDRVTEF